MSLVKEGAKNKYPNAVVLFELYTDNSEMFVLATDPDADWNEFVLVWGDYVANGWEEKYNNLSEATARMAQVIYVGEVEEQEGECVMFEKHGDEFVSAWNNFNKETTSVS